MKLAKQIMAALAVMTLGTLAAFFIGCSPADDSQHWVAEFYGSKALGMALAFTTWKLYNVLDSKDWDAAEETEDDYFDYYEDV